MPCDTGEKGSARQRRRLCFAKTEKSLATLLNGLTHSWSARPHLFSLASGNHAPLLDAVRDAGAAVPAPATLRFYCLAYAAFRVGQTTLCAQMIGHDPDDQARLWRARDGYRDQLARLLDAAS